MNNYEADFRACRACLSPASVFDSLQTFTSLFAENGKNVEKFGFISGIDISSDAGQHDALICRRCFLDLEKAFELRQQMRRAETQYFQPKRLEHFKANLPLNLEVIINQFNDTHTEPVNSQEENPAYLHKHEETDDIPSDDKTSEVKIVSLKSVKKKSQKKFECSVCFRIFHAKDQLQDHMKQAHQVKVIKRETSSNGTIRKDGPGVRHCSFCSETFRDKWKLNRHILRSHQSAMPLKNTTSDSSRPFKCDHDGCQKFFKSKQALKSHQTTHSNVRDFVCDCGETFKTGPGLKYHRKSAHNQ